MGYLVIGSWLDIDCWLIYWQKLDVDCWLIYWHKVSKKVVTMLGAATHSRSDGAFWTKNGNKSLPSSIIFSLINYTWKINREKSDLDKNKMEVREWTEDGGDKPPTLESFYRLQLRHGVWAHQICHDACQTCKPFHHSWGLVSLGHWLKNQVA